MLSETLLERLACPVCRGRPFTLAVEETEGDRLVEADLGCPDCGRWYPVRDDIPRMMPQQLASNLSAADDAWAPWASAMHNFLRWREEAWGDPEDAALRRERAREMHRRFIDFCGLPAGPQVLLDVGCGTGHIADLLPDGVDYIGIDPLPAGLSPGGGRPAEMPRPQRPVNLVQSVGETLPFAEDCFDVVLMMGTLDHSRSPAEVLAQAARVIRPGGTVGVLQGLTSDRSGGGLSGVLRSLLRSLSGRQDLGARETHLHTFASVDEVADLLAAHFDVLDVTEDSGRAFLRARAPGSRA